ncbi:MAG: hypothetical protein U0Y68_23735 [Blastocatellia bacterium]
MAQQLPPGTVREDLVSFVDFAQQCWLWRVSRFQQECRDKFAGPQRARQREYIYAASDRMDNQFDRTRAVRDKRFHYIRNFHPELPYSQRNSYNEENPTMQVWRKLSERGQLSGAPALFFAPTKAKEELCDTQTDPDEIHNLAIDAKYQKTLLRLRKRLEHWIKDTKDLGEIPRNWLSAG